jgi:hypothetical protein
LRRRALGSALWLLATILCLAWFIKDKTFEPLVTLLFAIAGLLGTRLISRRFPTAKSPSNTPRVPSKANSPATSLRAGGRKRKKIDRINLFIGYIAVSAFVGFLVIILIPVYFVGSFAEDILYSRESGNENLAVTLSLCHEVYIKRPVLVCDFSVTSKKAQDSKLSLVSRDSVAIDRQGAYLSTLWVRMGRGPKVEASTRIVPPRLPIPAEIAFSATDNTFRPTPVLGILRLSVVLEGSKQTLEFRDVRMRPLPWADRRAAKRKAAANKK